MWRWAIIFSLALAGCMGGNDDTPTAPSSGKIRTGLYEARENFTLQGVFIETVTQFRLGEGGVYTGSVYANDIHVIEYKGKWSHSGALLSKSELLQRTIVPETGSMGPWEQTTNQTQDVRNITSTSYQYYLDLDKISAEERAMLEGMKSGWRTCNRISD